MPPFGELDRIKRILEAKRRELLERYDAEGIEVEPTADAMDLLVRANERDLIVDRLNRENHLIWEVSEALARIADGDYGDCAECGEAIPAKRLAALPWAALCLRCQEAADGAGRVAPRRRAA